MKLGREGPILVLEGARAGSAHVDPFDATTLGLRALNRRVQRRRPGRWRHEADRRLSPVEQQIWIERLNLARAVPVRPQEPGQWQAEAMQRMDADATRDRADDAPVAQVDAHVLARPPDREIAADGVGLIDH